MTRKISELSGAKHMYRSPLHALGEKSADKSRSDRKPLNEIRIRAGKSGGFIVIHLGKPGDASEPDEHAIVDRKSLLKHIDNNAPEPAEGDNDED